MIRTKCEHGEMVGKAGVTENKRLPYAGLFCPEKICEPVWFITKFKKEVENEV